VAGVIAADRQQGDTADGSIPFGGEGQLPPITLKR